MKKILSLLLIAVANLLPAQNTVSEKDSLEIYKLLSVRGSRQEVMNARLSALEKAKSVNWDYGIGNSYRLIAVKMTENRDSAEILFQLADHHMKKSGSLAGQGAVLIFRANYERNFKNEPKRVEYLLEAVKFMEQAALPNPEIVNRLVQAKYDLSISAQHLKKEEEGMQYLDSAIELIEKYGCERFEGLCYLAKGGILQRLNRDEEGMQYLEKALKATRKAKNQRSEAKALNRIAVFYIANADYDSAYHYFIQTLETAQKINHPYTIMCGNAGIGNVLTKKRKFEEGFAYLKKAETQSFEQKKFYEYCANLLITAENRAFAAKPKEAVAYFQKYITAKDSLINEEKILAIQELETRFETQKKEATIALKEEQINRQKITLWFSFGAGAMLLGLALLFYRNFTAKRKANEILQKKNEEINLLIKEIHHRVKNNLQILASLLNLQSRYIKNPAALDAVKEGKNRVESMSILHQKLYMGDNAASVQMQEYLKHLCENILDTFGADENNLHMNYNVQNISLDIDTAIPLGLIINELITNSMKYAFAENQSDATINLDLNIQNDRMILQVSDNGSGENLTGETGTSFGTGLVEMLSKKLDGEISIEKLNGYSTEISFETFKLIEN